MRVIRIATALAVVALVVPNAWAAPQDEYAEHCAEMDILSAPLRDCFSYYNGDGKAKPGSLAYYGGGETWHKLRMAAQESMAPYVLDTADDAISE